MTHNAALAITLTLLVVVVWMAQDANAESSTADFRVKARIARLEELRDGIGTHPHTLS